jgi:hypothetical protein
MSILSGLGEGGWGLFAGWIVPAAIAVVGSLLLIFPDNLPVASEFNQLETAERALVLAFASVAIGFLLSAAQDPLYRILEGYILWPDRLKKRRREAHLAIKRQIEVELASAREARTEASEVEVNLLEEKLERFPIEEGQCNPTALGNAIRAFETYGRNRYQLDSQTLWNELLAAAPEPVGTEVERSRVPTDFCVASFYLALPFGLLALVAGAAQSTDRCLLLIVGGAALASLPGWYWLAVSSVSAWRSSVQALVNVSRVSLAQQLGLELPPTIEEERRMWAAFSWFVLAPYDKKRAAALDPFRARRGGAHRAAGAQGPR